MLVGVARLSKATYDNCKSVEELKWSGDDLVDSLTLRSPKYARQQATQVMMSLEMPGCFNQTI